MKTINRNKIQRMIDGYGTYAMGGSGSNGGDMPAGVATQAWTMENFLSIEFFSKLFKAYGPAEEEGDPDVEIVPNDVEGTISNIQAMFGFWTEQYISALGQGSGGGGGGGDLNEPLASINTAGLATHPGSAGQTIIWNGSAWVYGSVLNQGVTSVGLSAPTGFNVAGSPITTSGTLALSFASGYELPLAADTAKGVTAYGWGDHSLAGYALASNVYSKTDADAKFLTIAFFRSLFKAYTSASAEVVPNAGDTTTISSIKAMFGFWTEQYISALGQGSGGGGGVTLNEPLNGINNASLGSPSSAGQTLVWNGSAWKYSSATGISATSLNVGGSASISGALSVAGNITTSAGGFIVSGKDDTYVLLAGGGTKLLSEIGGGGAVNSITIGQSATVYSPDANGNVNIPPYPSTANLVSGISLNGDVVQPSSGIAVLGGLTKTVKVGDTSYSVSSAGVVSLPAYPTVPTTISSFTNDSGYITGITSSMVTTALGYTPANAASLTGYLPLSGGTMTGVLYTNQLINLGATAKAITTRGLDGAEIDGTQGELYINNNHNANVYICYGGGNVGIGTLSANYKLTVSGTVNATSFIKTNGTSSQFLKADGSVDSTSYLALTGGTLTNSGSDILTINRTNSQYTWIRYYINGSLVGYIGVGSDNNPYFNSGTGVSKIWCSGNDGSGSELDADLLDGQHGSYYASASSLSGYLPLTGGSLTGILNISKSDTADLINLYRTASGGSYVAYYANNGSHFWRAGMGAETFFNWQYDNTVLSSIDTNGNISISGDLYSTKNPTTSEWLLKVNNNTIIRVHPQSLVLSLYDSTNGSIQLRASSTSDTTGTKQLTILSDGYAGVGTTAPSYKWHVAGNGYYTGILYTNQIINLGATSYAIRTRGLDGASATGEMENLYINNNHNGNVYICYGGGNVGIGTLSPSYKLDVTGVIYSSTGVYSAGYVTALSDARRKDVQGDVMLTAEDVANAPMVKFLWKDRANGRSVFLDNATKASSPTRSLKVGSIAQYWQRYLPEAIVEDKDGYLTMDYSIIALLSSIATARKVKDHERRIAELERENNELKKRLNAA